MQTDHDADAIIARLDHLAPDLREEPCDACGGSGCRVHKGDVARIVTCVHCAGYGTKWIEVAR